MTVTKVEPLTKTRYKVYLDEQFAFVLYKGELSRFHIAEGGQLDQVRYEEIRKEVVLKRAKLRAMHLLTDMGRTEAGLRQKLKQGDYPEDIVEEAVAYVKSFGYVNDLEYAKSFIMGRKERKSRKELFAALCQKGVPKETVEEAFEECYESGDSREAIEAILRKKHYGEKGADPEKERKIIGYLVRKGFRYEDVRQVIQVSEWNA